MSVPKKMKYAHDQLKEAYNRVKNGELSMNLAAQMYGIPRSTLGDKLRGRFAVDKIPQTVLTKEEEDKIVTWLVETSRRGCGRTKEQLLLHVQRVLAADGRPNPFKNNKPGDKWYYAFLRRHPEISTRKDQALGKQRALISHEGVTDQSSPTSAAQPGSVVSLTPTAQTAHDPNPSLPSVDQDPATPPASGDPGPSVLPSDSATQSTPVGQGQSSSSEHHATSAAYTGPSAPSTPVVCPGSSSAGTLDPSYELKTVVDRLMDFALAQQWTPTVLFRMRRCYEEGVESGDPDFAEFAHLYSKIAPTPTFDKLPLPQRSKKKIYRSPRVQPPKFVSSMEFAKFHKKRAEADRKKQEEKENKQKLREEKRKQKLEEAERQAKKRARGKRKAKGKKKTVTVVSSRESESEDVKPVLMDDSSSWSFW